MKTCLTGYSVRIVETRKDSCMFNQTELQKVLEENGLTLTQ